jgi:hypothetical protein
MVNGMWPLDPCAMGDPFANPMLYNERLARGLGIGKMQMGTFTKGMMGPGGMGGPVVPNAMQLVPNGIQIMPNGMQFPNAMQIPPEAMKLLPTNTHFPQPGMQGVFNPTGTPSSPPPPYSSHPQPQQPQQPQPQLMQAQLMQPQLPNPTPYNTPPNGYPQQGRQNQQQIPPGVNGWYNPAEAGQQQRGQKDPNKQSKAVPRASMEGGMMPGQMPGQMPGMMPGQMPGQMPGMMPGQMPGMIPGQMQGQMPRDGAGGKYDQKKVDPRDPRMMGHMWISGKAGEMSTGMALGLFFGALVILMLLKG